MRVFLNECLRHVGSVWRWGDPLTSTTNKEVIYQEWSRLIYGRGFQLISAIQHAILQIYVCVSKGYANESVCEEWVKLGECVRGVGVRICYRTDVFYVVDV